MNRIVAAAALALLSSCDSTSPNRMEGDGEEKAETVVIPESTQKFDLVRVPVGEGLPGFWMGKHEVSFERFNFYFDDRDQIGVDGRVHPSEAGRSFMLAKIPKRMQRRRSPMTNLRWNSAVGYCDWLSRKTGDYYRLPTEREWEHACRAGEKGPAPAKRDALAWHKGNSGDESHLGGEAAANAFGLHDMLGNAWEYCLEHDTPPHFKAVLRGGAWNMPPEKLGFSTRTTVRSPWFDGDPNRPRSTWFLPGEYSQGFRVVRVAGKADAKERAAYASTFEIKLQGRQEHVHKIEKAVDFYRHVTGTIRNTGNRTLVEVELLVYYLDEDGKIHVLDRQPSAGKPGRSTWGKCWPVLESAARDKAARDPLKPGETRAFAVDLQLSFDEPPDVDPDAFGARVTNLRFADSK